MSSNNLSQGDQRILFSVFDPENSPDTPTANIDPTLPEDAHIRDTSLLAQLRSRELQAVRLVEQYSTDSSATPNLSFGGPPSTLSSASSQDTRSHIYEQSHSILSQLISEYPTYASAYNNRAQLRRWYHGNNLLSIAALRSEENKQVIAALDAVFEDLDEAIKLASPSGTNAAVSAAQSKLLAQVWTQRGAILWGLAKALQKDESTAGRPIEQQYELEAVPEWRAWDAMQLEEEGSRSFYLAGLYGSEVGRAMAVKTNPYARLCAGIVKEAMASEYDAYKQ